MTLQQKQNSEPRRRSRTFGWFDHGDKSLYPLRTPSVDRPTRLTTWDLPHTYTLERHLPTIRLVLLVATRILATIAILGPAIIVSTTSLRSVQMLCQHHALSRNATVCNNVWTKPQLSVLYNLPAGKTPITTTLTELDTLNTISPSLEFLGLPLFTASLNLSSVLTDLETSVNKTQLEALQPQNLFNAGALAHERAESFSSKEVDFRRVTAAWDDHGTNELQLLVTNIAETLHHHSDWISITRESVYHAVPFLSKQSVSYKLLLQYHHFVSHHQLAVRDLVMHATESRLLLQNFLGTVIRLETRLSQIAPARATRDLVSIRRSTAWAVQVAAFAEAHYKTVYSSLHAWTAPLAAEVASYDSWWLSRPALRLSRLRDIVEMERRQLDRFHARSAMVDEAMEVLYNDFMSGGPVAAGIRYKLDVAAREGQLSWL